MTLSNPNSVVTEQRLHDFYTEILPYLGRVEAGYTPVGSVIIMSGNEAPTNYLACDGTVYNIADYPELAAFYARSQGSCNFYGGNGTTTFAVPDWRGEFIRGAGTNSHENQGSGRAVGLHQDATSMPSIHSLANKAVAIMSETVDGTVIETGMHGYDSAYNHNSGTNGNKWLKYTGVEGSTSSTAALITTRPTNTSVLFCVAVKNIYLNPSLDYSTEEKVVGTWIDGKTIYQKTFVYAGPITWSSTPHDVAIADLSSLNIDNVISAPVGSCITGVSWTYLPWALIRESIQTWIDVHYYNNEKELHCRGYRSNGSSSITDIQVTLRYTKTTD